MTPEQKKDLLLSILAMDSYNRGYDEGIEGLGGLQSQVSAATLVDQSNVSDTSEEVKASFYAAAYTVGSEIVIAYRGSVELQDFLVTDLQLILNGAITSFIPRQAELAAQFYLKVKQDNPGKTIVLTGHSLGGVMAGRFETAVRENPGVAA